MKKKVVLFIPHLNIRGGGASKVGSSLTVELSDKFDFSIISLFSYEENLPYNGTYTTLNIKNLKQFYLKTITKLHKLQNAIKASSPDIIISFMNYTSFWIIPVLYLYKIKVPLILSINSNPIMQYRKRFIFKILIRILYPLKRLVAIVPVSKELKTIFINRFKISSSKILPIYNGIDINYIQKMSKEKLTEYNDIFDNPEFFKFITIGRISGEKGQKYLIQAFYDVLIEIPNSRLFIIGGGAKNELERIIKQMGLEGKVFLLGYQNNPYKYLSRSDIFVLPSLFEGLPYTLIEALICEIPIISTDCPTGPKEILDNGRYGILAKVADSKDLAIKMINLAKDKNLRQQFSELSHEQIGIFERNKFFKNWSKLIEYILARSKSK